MVQAPPSLPPVDSDPTLAADGEGATTWTIPALLAEAERLRLILPPIHSWQELRTIISECDLAALNRHVAIESIYATHFGPLVKRTHGSMEHYLRGRLGWGLEVAVPDGRAGAEREYWSRDDEVQVRRNDWAYGVPHEVLHWVVWTPLPILHPSLCPPPATPSSTTTSSDASPGPSWEDISRKGLSGFTGQPAGEDLLPGFGSGAEGPGREVEAFVKARWKETEWETAWFVNPPALQSVPGLSHFHVLAKPKLTTASTPHT